MTVCVKCHRPLKRPSSDGYGPVCRKTAAPIPEVGCDLFGFDVDAAVAAARARMVLAIAALCAEAHIANRRMFNEGRVTLGVWSK